MKSSVSLSQQKYILLFQAPIHKLWGCFMLAMAFSFMLPSCLFAQETFYERLKTVGIDEIKKDWSAYSEITLPAPTCAYANITGIKALPTQKTDNYKAWIDFYDGNGNYFRKRIIINTQGHASTIHAKKTYKIDLCEDEWIGEETPEITFGDWVPQDGFHLKGFYNEMYKGIGIIAYRTYDIIARDRSEHGRIWERASNIKNPDPRALCHPEAFPVIIYLNGDFWGIYCWQLKKHRKNMNMKKNTPEHIHLEGIPLHMQNIFGGNINWTGIWVRTPKDLYDMNGNVYDSDHPKELMDETSPYYDLPTDDDKTKERKQNSAQVKKYLQTMSHYFGEVTDLVKKGASRAEVRAAIDERFDVASMIDYMCHNLLTVNWDGIHKNYQWITYDGKKWFMAPYDLDNTFGYGTNRIVPAGYYNYYSLGGQKFVHCPTYLVYLYLRDEWYQRWRDLRDMGSINADNIYALFDSWYHSVGETNYANERNKWPNADCYTDDIDNEPWKQLPYNYEQYYASPAWDANTTYEKNTTVRIVDRLYIAKEQVKGVRPYKQVGRKDSLERIYPWLKEHIAGIDRLTGYTFTSIPMSYSLVVTSAGWSTLCIPFSFVIPEGMTFYTVVGTNENGGLKLREVTTPEAYKPYLVKAAPGIYMFTGYSEERPDSESDLLEEGCLRGTIPGRYVPAGNYVLQSHNGQLGFYRVAEDGKVKIGANRAWLTLSENSANSILVDDNAMGVYATESAPQMVDVHDMSGMRTNGMQKGVNIIRYSNGKTLKVIR